MKKLTLSLLALALLAVPAQAQRRGPAPPSPEEMQKKRDQAELDQQYKNAIRRSSNESTPAKVDPWANMRGTNEAKR